MRVRTGVLVSLLTAAMLLSVLAPLARAYIPEPYELYGVAKLDTGVVLDNGAPIRSFVDGVDYSNKTSVFSRPAQNDGYFDIDTYGNHRTNLTDPGTPWIKEGADDNEPIMYSYGDFSNNTQIGGPSSPWLTGKVFKETHNWQTGLPPQAGDLNLPVDAVQPPLLKIYSLTTNSTIVPYTDYVWLCNPTNTPVDASEFYLEKDILGSFNGPQVQVPAGTILPYRKYFVDTGSLNYFVESGDNLKLVWKNSGGPTGAFGGSDTIIDRVEFNRTGGTGTLNWEPGNTIMNDEPAPGRGFQLNRSASCRDTNSAQRDFFTDIEIRQNDPPGLPDPICLQGLCNWNIDNRLFHILVLSNFPINWTHHDNNTDPQGQANIYISTLPNGVNKIWTGVVNGPTQSTTYTGLPLLPANNYCLGVQTRDASQWGPIAEMCFRTNGLPAPVNRNAPTNGASGVPAIANRQVWWTFMNDPDPGDLLNYSWAVSTSPSMTPTIASGVTTNNYSSAFATVASTTYYWCVNETDGWQWVNQCNTPWQFTTGTPPTPPFANNLKIATFDSANAARLHMTAVNRVTPLLDWDFNPGTRSQTGFHVQVRKADDTLYWELNNTGAGGDLSQVTYAGPAFVDGECYYYYVKVRDNGAPQLWSTAFSTSLDFCMNTAPPAPNPLAPADDSVRVPGNTVIYWSVVVDPNVGDSITYEYCVGTADPPYPACGTTSGTPTANNSNGFTTSDGTNYYWAVRAFDSYEYSAWSAVWNFTARAPPANTPPNISITAPGGGEQLKMESTFTITWTMSDAEDANAALVVFLNYSQAGVKHSIARVVGVQSYVWTVPNSEMSGVTIEAIVIDTGGLSDTDTSLQFSIVKKEVVTDNTMLYVLLIVIIVVVLALILFFLMKRKKPKEEEEAPAKPEEEPAAEEEMEEEEAPAPAPPPKAAPKPVAAAPTKTPAKTKECPSCGTIVSVTDKECFMCGAKL